MSFNSSFPSSAGRKPANSRWPTSCSASRKTAATWRSSMPTSSSSIGCSSPMWSTVSPWGPVTDSGLGLPGAGNISLLSAANDFLETRSEDGTLDQLVDQYFGHEHYLEVCGRAYLHPPGTRAAPALHRYLQASRSRYRHRLETAGGGGVPGIPLATESDVTYRGMWADDADQRHRPRDERGQSFRPRPEISMAGHAIL